MDIITDVTRALGAHPSIRTVRLAGSRRRNAQTVLSDWDFVVETDDFAAVARDLPELVRPLDPLAAQWDPYADIVCYMLILPGAEKVDLLFPDHPRAWSGAWVAGSGTLVAIDKHFWDWILWLAQKAEHGERALLRDRLRDMHRLMLGPLGVDEPPHTIDDAIGTYLRARETNERRFGVRVDRRLGEEVLSRLRRHGYATAALP